MKPGDTLRPPDGAPVTVVRALRLIDGVPASIVHTYFESTLGRDLLARRVHEEDAMTLLEEELGMRLDHTQIAATAKTRARSLGFVIASTMSFIAQAVAEVMAATSTIAATETA